MRKRLNLIKSLKFVYSNSKKLILFYLLLISISAPIMLISPKLFQILVDDVLAGKGFDKFIYVVFGLVAVYILRFIVDSLTLFYDNKISNTFTFTIRKKIFETYKSQKLNSCWFNDAGDLKLRLMDDVNNISLFTKEQIIDIVYNSLVSILGLSVFFVYSPIMALSCVCVVPLFFFVNKKIAEMLEKNNEEIRRINVGYYNSTYNAIKNRKEIKTQNSENIFIARFNSFRDKLAKLEIENIKYWFFSDVLAELKSHYISKVYVYCLGLIFLVNSKATIGEVLMFAEYFGIVFSALDVINVRNALLKEDAPFLKRVTDVLSLPVCTYGNVPFSFKEKIDFNIESFSYTDNCPILKNINFEIKKGEFIAITGESGCGKTTLMSFLVNANDEYKGYVSIDGVKIPNIKFEQLHKNIALVEQDEYIFNMSIRDNFLISNESATDTDILNILSKIGAIDIVQEKNQHLDTILGENGSRLSGGQRQKLGIARALLRSPQILILDEATNAIDAKSENEIIQAIRKDTNITIISVSHKPSMLKMADRIINIEVSNGNKT